MRCCILLVLCSAADAALTMPRAVTPALSWLGGTWASAGLLTRVGVAVPASAAALVALNIAQNGPERASKLSSFMQLEVGLTFDGPPTISGDGGDLPSGPFTPTDTAPETLEEVCGLRTKSDVVRAWRCGVAPALPGDGVLEVYDGAVLKRGILSPLSKFITNRLLGGFNQRWRGKVFESGKGCNRFGGARANRFGITNSDAKEIERQIRLKVLEKKAEMDPLLKAQLEQQKVAEGSTVSESSSAGAGDGASTDVAERGCRPFTYRIDDSRLDGRPCLVLEYATTGCTGGDALWGPVLGMRDEIREVVPGVLVGLGSFRATGGVRNCGASGTE